MLSSWANQPADLYFPSGSPELSLYLTVESVNILSDKRQTQFTGSGLCLPVHSVGKHKEDILDSLSPFVGAVCLQCILFSLSPCN